MAANIRPLPQAPIERWVDASELLPGDKFTWDGDPAPFGAVVVDRPAIVAPGKVAVAWEHESDPEGASLLSADEQVRIERARLYR